MNDAPLWTKQNWNLNDEQCRVLQQSLWHGDRLPWVQVNGVWVSRPNGKSLGTFQQICLDVNAAATPPLTWGWGTWQDCLDAEASTLMFATNVPVTDDPVYVTADGTRLNVGPVFADVLRVQRPMISEASSSNYSQARLDYVYRVAQSDRFFTDQSGAQSDVGVPRALASGSAGDV